jgi:hypothetical protein
MNKSGVCSVKPECYKEWARRRYQRDKDKIRDRAKDAYAADPEVYKDRHRLQQYGVTPEQYAVLLAEQGGGCAICGRSDTRLTVDHDHKCCPEKARSCGKCIRGLICNNCNLAIGLAEDNPDKLIQMAAYVVRWERVWTPSTPLQRSPWRSRRSPSWP